MNENEINRICKEYGIKNYTINSDGSIDVDGNVDISLYYLNLIPIKFNKVSGYFSCSNNYLTNLENSPNEVGRDFYCSYNRLSNLIGLPINIRGYTYCYGIESLEGYIGNYNKIRCDNKHIRKYKISLLKNKL